MNVDSNRCVCATLRKATRAVTQFYDRALRPSGLRATQFHILAQIRSAQEATVTELTRLLLMDQTTLTRSLSLLEREGLLKAVPKSDGRVKSMKVTSKGEQALQSAKPLWAAAQKRMVTAIGAETWTSLSLELARLAQSSAK